MPMLTKVSRREPMLAGSPQYTPFELNEKLTEESQGNAFVPSRIRDSLFNPRVSKKQVVFFLQPTGIDGGWGDWWAAPFIQGKNLHSAIRTSPAGRFTTADNRRNIDIPPTISYGDTQGATYDGVSLDYDEDGIY
jgi:hypothetical protein